MDTIGIPIVIRNIVTTEKQGANKILLLLLLLFLLLTLSYLKLMESKMWTTADHGKMIPSMNIRAFPKWVL